MSPREDAEQLLSWLMINRNTYEVFRGIPWTWGVFVNQVGITDEESGNLTIDLGDRGTLVIELDVLEAFGTNISSCSDFKEFSRLMGAYFDERYQEDKGRDAGLIFPIVLI